MARYRITSPDGKRTLTIEGPDNASDADLKAAADDAFGGEYAANPVDTSGVQRTANAAMVDPEAALLSDVGGAAREIGYGAAEGVATVLDKGADWLQAGLNAAGEAATGTRWGDSLAGGRRNNLAGYVPAQQDGYDTLRGIGRFGGEVAGTLPLAAVGGGALVQGGLGGALLSDAQDTFSVVRDAALGAAGGKAGELLFRGAASAAAPQVSADLRTLIDAGTRVTPGQVARSRGGAIGNFLARSEDRAVSTPFVGDTVVRARNESLGTFGRGAINRAVKPLGIKVPDSVPNGRAAVKWAGDTLSDAYDALLPNLSVTGDQQFLSELSSIAQEATTLAPGRTEQFNRILSDLGRFWQNGTTLDGRALKGVEERLGQRVRRLSVAGDADGQDMGDLLAAVQEAVRDAAARQNPQYAQSLQAINRGWKSLTQVERASANSKAAITPAGYSQAVRQSSDTVRRRGYARGEALNQDLSDAASDILPAEIADSGTAGRWQQSNPLAMLLGVPQALAYSGAQAVTPALTRSTATSPALARLLRQGASAAPIAAPAGIAEFRR